MRTRHLSLAYEEMVEVVTHAVAEGNIDWPAKRQDVCPESKLDECFLPIKSQPPFRSLISTPRCQDCGRNCFQPGYSVPESLITQI